MEGAVGSAGSGHHQDLICRTSGDREPMLLSLSSQVGHKQFVHPGGLLESCAESEGGSGVLNEKESSALALVALSLLAHWVSFGWAGRKVTLVQLAERWWHRAQGWQLRGGLCWLHHPETEPSSFTALRGKPSSSPGCDPALQSPSVRCKGAAPAEHHGFVSPCTACVFKRNPESGGKGPARAAQGIRDLQQESEH